ncbi:MAG: head-tail adaptor protein [Deltaproteobacteria bacterium]
MTRRASIHHPGEFDSVLGFDSPTPTDDAYGGTVAGWTPEIADIPAKLIYLRGGETVQAARLAGRQPVVAVVRRTERALAITTDWRMRDVRKAVDYNIRAIVPTEDRRYLEITAESGVAI